MCAAAQKILVSGDMMAQVLVFPPRPAPEVSTGPVAAQPLPGLFICPFAETAISGLPAPFVRARTGSTSRREQGVSPGTTGSTAVPSRMAQTPVLIHGEPPSPGRDDRLTMTAVKRKPCRVPRKGQVPASLSWLPNRRRHGVRIDYPQSTGDDLCLSFPAEPIPAQQRTYPQLQPQTRRARQIAKKCAGSARGMGEGRGSSRSA